MPLSLPLIQRRKTATGDFHSRKPLLSAEGAAAPEVALEKMGLLTTDENAIMRATVVR